MQAQDTTLDPRLFGNELVSPEAYADNARIHQALSKLRAHGKPHFVTPDNYRPFWAVGRHEIGRAHV